MENIIGKRFGKLVVVKDVGNGKFFCQCDCGKTKTTSRRCLVRHMTQSCGCLRKTPQKHEAVKEGQRYGRLTTVKKARSKTNRLMWQCQCDCGNVIDVLPQHLVTGRTKSCGCIKREKSLEVNDPIYVGKKMGKLTILEIQDNKTCLCQCICGKKVSIPYQRIVQQKVKTCGCGTRKKILGEQFGDFMVDKEEDINGSNYQCHCVKCNRTVSLSRTQVLNHRKCLECLAEEKRREWREKPIGQRFGNLTVIAFAEKRSFLCRCDCGNEIVCGLRGLQKGVRTSCGCKDKNNNIVGKKFGKLTVLAQHGPFVGYETLFDCLCECGRKVTLPRIKFTSGNVKTCGCSQGGRRSGLIDKIYKKKDYAYFLVGENEKVLVDQEDVEKISPHRWWKRKKANRNKAYIYGVINGKNVSLHRFIMGVKSGDPSVVDHINGNSFDNRKSNLRVTSLSENNLNMPKVRRKIFADFLDLETKDAIEIVLQNQNFCDRLKPLLISAS